MNKENFLVDMINLLEKQSIESIPNKKNYLGYMNRQLDFLRTKKNSINNNIIIYGPCHLDFSHNF